MKDIILITFFILLAYGIILFLQKRGKQIAGWVLILSSVLSGLGLFYVTVRMIEEFNLNPSARISESILNAFNTMGEKLNEQSINAQIENSELIKVLKETIDEGGTDKFPELKDTLDMLHAWTLETIHNLDHRRTYLEDSIIKRDNETGGFINLQESKLNLQYWMGKGDEQIANGGRGNGEAFKLHLELDQYVKKVVDLYNSQLKDKTQSLNPDDELMTKDPVMEDARESIGKTWEQYTFEGPAIANVATLEKIKLDIYEKEKEVLDIISGSI